VTTLPPQQSSPRRGRRAARANFFEPTGQFHIISIMYDNVTVQFASARRPSRVTTESHAHMAGVFSRLFELVACLGNQL
jgi:hypothetical protein